jgi:hypothetical protein
MFPTIASPVSIQILMDKGGKPQVFFHLSLSSFSLICCSKAVLQAMYSGLAIVIGALKNPITASQIYLSNVHLFEIKTSVISERYSHRSAKILSVPSISEIVVKPTMSEKNIVTFLFSHQSLRAFSSFAIKSTISFER